MRKPYSQEPVSPDDYARRIRWRWILVVFCALVFLAGFLRARRQSAAPTSAETSSPGLANENGLSQTEFSVRHPRLAPPALSAEEIVAGKLAQFARSRLGYAQALALRHKVQISGDIERFFAAVESGNWDDIEAAFKKINGGDSSAGHSKRRTPEIENVWPAIIDAYGAGEQVHLWPAQKLLDYGNSVLGALRPGMVYVGGTDNGRWIPELVNDTSDGEHHIIVTQNALADGTYLDYLRLQYDDRLTNLSDEDSKRAFDDCVADAQKRLQHDQQFPDEPKQVRPGEDIHVADGKVQVGGQMSVMAINERLLESLMQKNPDLSFAIQESFPFKGTYADALPLGPLMELRARDEQNSFTAERAAQSLDYWRDTAQQILSDPEALGSEAALSSYSHDAVAAANLLAAHNFPAEAEEAYRLATQFCLENPEAIYNLGSLLAGNGRVTEARQLLDDFARKYPAQRKGLEQMEQSTAAGPSWTATISKP